MQTLLSEIIHCFHYSVALIGPCLYESGLIPKKLSFMEDAEVLNYGIGMSNIVPRTTRSAIELSRSITTLYIMCCVELSMGKST